MEPKCKCGARGWKNFAVITDKTHKGLYCSKCGLWQKWLGKNDYNLAIINGCKIIKK